MAPVGAFVTDLDVEDFEFGAKANDEVKDLGQYERVDDVTGDLNDALSHRKFLRLATLILMPSAILHNAKWISASTKAQEKRTA
jgi:hypothetical protein